MQFSTGHPKDIVPQVYHAGEFNPTGIVLLLAALVVGRIALPPIKRVIQYIRRSR